MFEQKGQSKIIFSNHSFFLKIVKYKQALLITVLHQCSDCVQSVEVHLVVLGSVTELF